MAGQRDHILQHLHVVVGEADGGPGFVAARLLRSSAGINSDRSGTESVPDMLDGTTKTLAIREKQHDSRDTPRHAQHSEQGLAEIVTHRSVSFGENIATHKSFIQLPATLCARLQLVLVKQLSARDTDRRRCRQRPAKRLPEPQFEAPGAEYRSLEAVAAFLAKP